MKDELVLIEGKGAVAVIQLNRPDKLNALSPELLAALAAALESLDKDDQIRVIVLYGGEKVFASGSDIEAMADASPMDIYLRNTRKSWQRIWAIEKPLVASVCGVAFGGGCELALSCDLIVAGESARFGQPEIKLGIMPGAGGTQRLSRIIGPARAMEMILTGEPIGASEALRIGLINRLVSDERVLDEAVNLAKIIAERPAIAARLARKALRRGWERTFVEGLELERRYYRLLYGTEDQKEGMRAFLGKRPPKFKGR